MTNESECPGVGLCHGPTKWCSTCGSVIHVCDTRLRGERCDEHPVPPTWQELRRERAEAERMIRDGERLLLEGNKALGEVEGREAAREAYGEQLAEEERKLFAISHPEPSSA